MSVRLSRTSREYVYITGIKAFADGEVADPTTLPVEVAFVAPDALPATGDWKPAQWQGATTARVLVGPNALVVAPGAGDLWLRVRGAVEQPEHRVDSWEVF